VVLVLAPPTLRRRVDRSHLPRQFVARRATRADDVLDPGAPCSGRRSPRLV